MPTYSNHGKDSGVVSYELTQDSISVTFGDNSEYLYNYDKPGESHVSKMIELAKQGEGLNSYINTNVRKNYAKKLR